MLAKYGYSGTVSGSRRTVASRDVVGSEMGPLTVNECDYQTDVYRRPVSSLRGRHFAYTHTYMHRYLQYSTESIERVARLLYEAPETLPKIEHVSICLKAIVFGSGMRCFKTTARPMLMFHND